MNGFSSPYSIDVKQIQKGGYRAVVNYLSKYLTKANYSAVGRSFGMSSDLQKARTPLKIPAGDLPFHVDRSRIEDIHPYIGRYVSDNMANLFRDYLEYLSKNENNT